MIFRFVGYFVLGLAFAIPGIALDPPFSPSLEERFDTQFRAVLEARNHTVLSAEVTSTVEKVSKRMGEAFQEDETLLQLDDRIFSANEKKAQAVLAKAQTDLETQRRLYRDKVISTSELREAEVALAIAETDLVVAKHALEACTLTAPYNGKVVEVFVKEHERVEPGQKLIEILEDHILIAKLLLPEEFLGKIHVGDTFRMKIEETGTEHPAKIVRVGATLDPTSSLLKVDAEIDNESDTLRAGMEGMLLINED